MHDLHHRKSQSFDFEEVKQKTLGSVDPVILGAAYLSQLGALTYTWIYAGYWLLTHHFDPSFGLSLLISTACLYFTIFARKQLPVFVYLWVSYLMGIFIPMAFMGLTLLSRC